LLCFLAWKTLLLLVVASSPAEGYDTSTSLSYIGQTLPNPLHHMIGKLTRWDAIYFVKVARRGYRFEQDWAWGWGFTRMVAFCTTSEKTTLF
jgi:phosphatidylinositol glycan class V